MPEPTPTSAAAPARPTRAPIAILSYHQTTPPPPRGTPVRTLVLQPWRFALQMRTLRMLGWQGLSMRELEPYLNGQKTGKVFGVTLDDGYLNNFEHALPVLREVGFTATAYMVSAQIGGTNAWDHDKGVPPAPLMDLPHLKDWIAAGMEVGAHTRHHVNLCECSRTQAWDEIAGCKRELEELLGVEVRSFAYPYGEHRPEHAQMVREAGYATGATIVSSRARWDDDPLRLPRISLHLEDSLAQLVAQVTTDYEDWRMSRPRWRKEPVSRWYVPPGSAALGSGASAT